MTTQTPDAVREALQAKHDRIHPTNRRPDLPIMLKMTFGDLCAILAALDSRAGDAGEVVAWIYEKKSPHSDLVRRIVNADRDNYAVGKGWTETPLYRSPTPAPAVDAQDHFRDATKMVDRNAVIQECASALATYCKRMNEAGKEPSFYDAREAILAMRSESAPAVDAVPAGEVDWTKFAFITGFEQALHNSSMTAEDFYAEWKHAGFPGAPSALSHGEGRK